MPPERKVLIAVAAVLVLAVLVALLLPRVREELAPQPKAAWVAIEPEGSGVAEVGSVEIAAGTPFTLHAVLEATARDGSTVYYTQAPRLRIHGAEAPPAALRRWDRRLEARVLWFTLEGSVPWIQLRSPEELDHFRFRDFLRVDWPQTWSIPGRLDPAFDDELAPAEPSAGPNPFGTERYQVRIELYGRASAIVPVARYVSWGADQLAAHREEMPAVVASLPGAAGPASRVFGLTQIDPPPSPPLALLERLETMTRQGLAYSPVPLLRLLIAAAGTTPEKLEWRLIDLAHGPAWGSEVAAGDLLRVGSRFVVLYQDRGGDRGGDHGKSGVLDPEDLCLDFAKGAAVRPLSHVFSGSGEVELARLTRPAAGGEKAP